MTLEEARQRVSETDWARFQAITDEEIAAAVASDPDAAPIDDGMWGNAVLVIPDTKKPVSLRLDADIVDWFRSEGRGYQTRINAVLKSYVDAQKRRRKKTATGRA